MKGISKYFLKSYFSDRKSYFAIFNVNNLTESDKILLVGKYDICFACQF